MLIEMRLGAGSGRTTTARHRPPRPRLGGRLLLAAMAWALVGGRGIRAQSAPTPIPAMAPLYAQIANAPIDPGQVYRIDGLDIDDEDIHISLIHGTLGFITPPAGVNVKGLGGAVFEGQGEVLVMPPDAADRLAMANFTGAAILDEQFNSAYFRFTDGALRLSAAELAQALPAATEGDAMRAKWRETVVNLNASQGLRMLAEILNHNRTPYFYARFGGEHLGGFQALVDRSLPEQVIVARGSAGEGAEDVWASFPMRSARASAGTAQVPDPRDLVVDEYKVRTEIGNDLALRGDTEIDFHAVTSGDHVLAFNLAPGLRLTAVTDATATDLAFVQFGVLHVPAQAGALPAYGRLNSRVVAAILPAGIEAGRHYRLHFSYAGQIIFAAAHGLDAIADRADWYPNRPGQPAVHDLVFTYPAALTLVATGMRVADAAAGQSPQAAPPPGYARSHWLSQQPLMLAGFNLGNYQEVSAEATSPHGKVVIQVYGAQPPPAASPVPGGAPVPATRPAANPAALIPPAPTPQQLQAVAAESARTIEFFEQRFGPFAYPRLAITELPLRLGQGWPGLLYLATDSFLSPAQLEDLRLPPQARMLYPLMRPHEIAHQWWGDEVGWHDYHDQWLPEALASYSSLLYLEAQPGGAAAMRQVLAQNRDALLRRNAQGATVESAGPIWLGLRLDSSRFPNAYDVIVYDKGAWFFHMLREMLRRPPPRDAEAAVPAPAAPAASLAPDAADDAFFALLRDFCRTYAGKAPTTADFERVAERHMPPALDLTQDGSFDWFFREWLDWTGIPAYRITGEHWTHVGGPMRVAGVLEQLDVPQGFLMPVPIYLRAGQQVQYLGTVVAQGPSTAFSLPAPAAGDLLIDPRETILKR